MIAGSYRAYEEVVELVIELIRQFYDVGRAFRIADPSRPGEYRFVELDTRDLIGRPLPGTPGTEQLLRRPVFDIRVRAQKKNPFSRMEQNERARQLFALGFFRPERRREALLALDMMDFEGIERVKGALAGE